MTMMRESAKYDVLGYQWGKMTDRRSVNIPWVKQIFTKENDMENDETKRYQEDLYLFLGEVSEWFGEEEEGGS